MEGKYHLVRHTAWGDPQDLGPHDTFEECQVKAERYQLSDWSCYLRQNGRWVIIK